MKYWFIVYENAVLLYVFLPYVNAFLLAPYEEFITDVELKSDLLENYFDRYDDAHDYGLYLWKWFKKCYIQISSIMSFYTIIMWIKTDRR